MAAVTGMVHTDRSAGSGQGKQFQLPSALT